MKKIKKVLIAMDYYKTSKKGFTMAKTMNAKVILLHVISEQRVYYSSYAYMSELWVNFIGNLEYSTQKLLDKTKKYLKNESIRTTIKQEKLLKRF